MFIAIGSSIYYFCFREKKESEQKVIMITEDEIKFKNEYESLNDTIREGTGVLNPSIKVITDNNL